MTILERLDGSAPAPDLDQAELKAIGAFEEIDTTRALKAASREGIDFYVAASRTAEDRFCGFALRSEGAGVFSSFTCLPRSGAPSGLAVVELQTRTGGIEAPRVYFGVVPDGVLRATSAGEVQEVRDNVYSFARPDGNSLSTITFETPGGRVEVKVRAGG